MQTACTLPGTDLRRLISSSKLWALPPGPRAHQANSAKRKLLIRRYPASLGSGYEPVKCFDTLDHDLIPAPCYRRKVGRWHVLGLLETVS